MSNQLPGQANFEVSQEDYINALTGGERQLTIHEVEAVKRKGSLVLAWDTLAATDPMAIQGEPRPHFEELNEVHRAPSPTVAPGVVALGNAVQQRPTAQNEHELNEAA